MINRFKYRSAKSELLDLPVRKEFVLKNQKELDLLNKYLGGYATSFYGIKKIIREKNKNYIIADLGCGSGGFLLTIAKWAKHAGFSIKLIGVDTNNHAINLLKKKCIKFPEIKGITSDFREYLKNAGHIDIIHCSLFCHHLDEKKFQQFIMLSRVYRSTFFVINDLARNWYLYYAVKLFTLLPGISTLARHDGPVSVLRGFKRKEIINLFEKNGIDNFSIQRKFIYRYLIILNTHLLI